MDTTVIESNIHYPTDSGLLHDGARGADTDHATDREESGQSEEEGAQERVRSVVRQTKARVFEGVTQFPGKVGQLI